MEATKQTIELLTEQVDRTWEAQQNYSSARARLGDACEALTKAMQALGDAMSDVQSSARVLGGMVVEIPTNGMGAEALKEKELSLKEVDVWIASTDAARESMVPACWSIAEAALILHNAEHGEAPKA